MDKVQGGYAAYGISVGIIMLETYFPRLVGDMGHARTFDFPVAYRIVQGALPREVVGGNRQLLEPFIAAARELEALGVRAITTNCGYLARFQQELAAAVRVPVFASSLLQVPLVYRMLGPGRKVGIVVADATQIDESVFRCVGWSAADIPVVVRGLESYPEFTRVVLENAHDCDFDLIREEVYQVCEELVTAHPEVGALVFECTDLPPYADYVRRRLGLPVFDIVTLTRMVHNAVRLPD